MRANIYRGEAELIEAASNFCRILEDPLVISDISQQLRCGEADALAKLFAACDQHDRAVKVIEAHERTDDPDAVHYPTAAA